MKLTEYHYSPLSVCVVSLIDNETFTFIERVATESYGVYVLSGKSDLIEGHSEEIGKSFIHTGLFETREHWNEQFKVKATGNSSWICFVKNSSGDKTLSQKSVNGVWTLPSETGFIVMEGFVTFNDLAIPQFGYFRPRNSDLEISGTAEILLINN